MNIKRREGDVFSFDVLNRFPLLTSHGSCFLRSGVERSAPPGTRERYKIFLIYHEDRMKSYMNTNSDR